MSSPNQSPFIATSIFFFFFTVLKTTLHTVKRSSTVICKQSPHSSTRTHNSQAQAATSCNTAAAPAELPSTFTYWRIESAIFKTVRNQQHNEELNNLKSPRSVCRSSSTTLQVCSAWATSHCPQRSSTTRALAAAPIMRSRHAPPEDSILPVNITLLLFHAVAPTDYHL